MTEHNWQKFIFLFRLLSGKYNTFVNRKSPSGEAKDKRKRKYYVFEEFLLGFWKNPFSIGNAIDE
jgi:hypothetical protein